MNPVVRSTAPAEWPEYVVRRRSRHPRVVRDRVTDALRRQQPVEEIPLSGRYDVTLLEGFAQAGR